MGALLQNSMKNAENKNKHENEKQLVEEERGQNNIDISAKMNIINDVSIFSTGHQNEQGWFFGWAPNKEDSHKSNTTDRSDTDSYNSNQQKKYEIEVQRLRRIIEEKEELLTGLRHHVKEICFNRYPILEERDQLRQEISDLIKENTLLRKDNEIFRSNKM